MEKIIFLLFFSASSLIWSQPLNRDSILDLIPLNFTGQLVVTQNNKFVFKENFGQKERVFKTLINDSTVFNVGQISHTIIYTLFKNLLKNKKLKPNDKVNQYITSFPYENIQIKHLLKQQSGLPSSYVKLYHRKVYNNWNLKITDRNGRIDNEDILYILINEKPKLMFSPGDSSAYSDINFLLLTSLIEKITNTSFENYLKQFFLQKLNFSPILSAGKDTIFNKAYGYRLFQDSVFQLCDNLKTRNLPFDDGTYGNQHIYLSASNLAHWGNFLLKKININKLNTKPGEEFMGGFKVDQNFQTVIKNGAFGGVSSKLILIPKNQLVIVINSSILTLNGKSEKFVPLEDYFQKLD